MNIQQLSITKRYVKLDDLKKLISKTPDVDISKVNTTMLLQSISSGLFTFKFFGYRDYAEVKTFIPLSNLIQLKILLDFMEDKVRLGQCTYFSLDFSHKYFSELTRPQQRHFQERTLEYSEILGCKLKEAQEIVNSLTL